MEAKSHSGADSRRVFVAVAVATIAATFTAGFAVGHRPQAEAAAHAAAALAPAPAVAPAAARDPSLPDAAEAIGAPATSTEEPTPTF